jgi:DNA-binding NarL/FixJ family response regulator
VAGDPFAPELAAAAAGLDERAAAQPLDTLLAVGLVRATDVPRRFRFRHPLVRRAVYESAPAAWRLGAHGRCASALAARGAPAAVRAHHVEHAAHVGDAKAVAVLAEAADAVFARAPASAAQWYAAALRVMPETAPAEQRAHLLMVRARSLGAIGELRDSRADLLAALTLVPEASAWWVGLTVACAGLEQLLGLHAEARARLADALHRLPEPSSAEAVALMTELAIADLFRTRYASMRDWAERAHAVARQLDNRPDAAAAASMLALAEALAGSADGTARIEAAALVGALPDEELARRPAAAANLAAADLFADRYDAALASTERVLAVERATGHTSPTVSTARALAWIMQGRLAAAADLLDSAIERIRVDGVAQGLAYHLAYRALAAVAEGDAETAVAAADEAVALARPLDEAFTSAWATVALAAALLESGQPADAEPLLASAPALPGSWAALARELLIRCRLAAGRTTEARATAAATVDLPMATVWSDRAEAALLLAEGEPGAAADRARAAATAADGAGAVVEAAVARVLAAQALAEAGDAAGAVTELERARAAFDACGATRRRERTEQELRRLGRRVHRRARPGRPDASGLDALTGRELEVAELVVDRRTNPEIAAELFLSLKTVETHLRNIFRKLDVSSRVELARAIERARRQS